jgi:hypothetical protein
MKPLFLLLLVLAPAALRAGEPWHMISFGRRGVGWSATTEDLQTRGSSSFTAVDYFLSDLALNYAYRLSARVQLGAFYEGSHSEYRFGRPGGGRSTIESEVNTAGAFVLYNFGDDLNDAWYTGYSFAITTVEEENSHDFENAEGKAPFELDDLTETHELIVGKRFSLRGFAVANLAFSPQLRLFYRTHGKDFDDRNVGDGTGATISPLRFDLLF